MSTARLLLAASLLAACAAQAQTQDAQGKWLFDRRCAECHAEGIGHPGTQRLGWSRGEKYAVLEKRSDLVPEYVKIVVRRGMLEMPAFRPSEISDRELEQLAAYLAGSKPARDR